MNIVVIIAPSDQTSLPSFLLEQKCVSKTKRKNRAKKTSKLQIKPKHLIKRIDQEKNHHLSVEISLCVGCLLLCCLLPGLVSASVSRWRWKIFVTKIVRVRDDGEEWRQFQWMLRCVTCGVPELSVVNMSEVKSTVNSLLIVERTTKNKAELSHIMLWYLIIMSF